MEACEKMGLTSGWMDEKNRELGLISESTKDNEDEQMELDAETAAEEFIQKIYQDITPTMERVLTCLYKFTFLFIAMFQLDNTCLRHPKVILHQNGTCGLMN